MPTRIATAYNAKNCRKLNTGNPLAYEDCNGVADPEENCPNTGNPLAYEDCNLSDDEIKNIATTGNPLAYEDCNVAVMVAVVAVTLATHLPTRIATAKYS